MTNVNTKKSNGKIVNVMSQKISRVNCTYHVCKYVAQSLIQRKSDNNVFQNLYT